MSFTFLSSVNKNLFEFKNIRKGKENWANLSIVGRRVRLSVEGESIFLRRLLSQAVCWWMPWSLLSRLAIEWKLVGTAFSNITQESSSLYRGTRNWIGLPRWLCGKESACNAGSAISITGSGRFPEGGNGNPLQYSYLENSMDRGTWQAIVHGIAQSGTRWSMHTLRHWTAWSLRTELSKSRSGSTHLQSTYGFWNVRRKLLLVWKNFLINWNNIYCISSA